MSILGDRLGLAEDAVLTSVRVHEAALDRLRPRWPRAGNTGTVEAGTLYLHRIDVPRSEDPGTVAASLVAHLLDGVVTLAGVHVDGEGWVATCQLALADHRFVDAESAAESAVWRASDLIDLVHCPRAVPLYTTSDLREACRGRTEADLRGWGIDLLLLGAVLEMSGMPIDEMVEEAEYVPWTPVATEAQEHAEQIEQRLRGLLAPWEEA